MNNNENYINYSLRMIILELCHRLGLNAAHLGGCLSIADIMDVLYSEILVYNKKDLQDENRDRVIMSKGHGSISMYAAMTKSGIINNLSDIGDLVGKGNVYYKQEVRRPEKGLEFSSGSLGQGLAYAVGIAWGLKRKNNKAKVFVIVGEGECEEGSIWEAASIASQLCLNNIIVIVDKNGLQIDGWTKNINSQEDIKERWKAFGFLAKEINGHNKSEIKEALETQSDFKPIAIIANTVKGKGISYAENNAEWHQNVVTDELYHKGMIELKGVSNEV